MRIARSPVLMLLCVMSVAAAACGGDGPTQVTPNETFIQLQSDAGDFIGGGQSFNHTPANSTIQVSYGGNRLNILVLGAWTGDFRTPGDPETLRNGTYTGAVLYPRQDPSQASMKWVSQARTCTSLTGSFTLSNVRYAGGELFDFDLTFEQHCNGAAPALRGTIHVRK